MNINSRHLILHTTAHFLKQNYNHRKSSNCHQFESRYFRHLFLKIITYRTRPNIGLPSKDNVKGMFDWCSFCRTKTVFSTTSISMFVLQ